jgi:GGDEF domain-containing protein
MSERDGNLVVVFTSNELYEAQAVHDALQAEGIAARVEGENLMVALGHISLASTAGPRVVVREEDEPQARAVLERWQDELRRKRAEEGQTFPSEVTTCLSCGAVMTASATCPRCGWSYRTGSGAT